MPIFLLPYLYSQLVVESMTSFWARNGATLRVSEAVR